MSKMNLACMGCLAILIAIQSCKTENNVQANGGGKTTGNLLARGIDENHPGFASLTITNNGQILVNESGKLRFGCYEGHLTTAIPRTRIQAYKLVSSKGKVTSNNQEINGKTASMANGALSINGVSCETLKKFIADDNASPVNIEITF